MSTELFRVKHHFVCTLQIVQKEVHTDGTNTAKSSQMLNLRGEYRGIHYTNISTLFLNIFFIRYMPYLWI